MPSYTINVPDIHQGTAYLWVNVTPPTTGTRLLVDASGNLTQGSPIPMGAIQGATTFHSEAKLEEVMIDQSTAGVDVIQTGETAYIETTLVESTLQKIAYALAHAQYSSGTDAGLPGGAQGYEEITTGGLVTIPKTCVAIVSPRRNISNPGKYFVACLYSAFAKNPYSVGYTKAKETVYKVRFDGLGVMTRPIGDQVSQYYRQV